MNPIAKALISKIGKPVHSERARMRRFNRKADKVDQTYKAMSNALSMHAEGGDGMDSGKIKKFAKKYE